eukprot:NODE_2664_length_1525_cov_25.780314_g2295_i0.p1 GENE.NODE_2664_length_1525_cov_25.780314_g2295_i0~~NODE_2664_length_1525_cov_25.780314_g2295_i0.p1  ORF type:complete len:475 (-),score=97.76 NODE_2664_length_1525_cov_25.780314_g2295_i0:36-1460(-)
MEDEGWVIYGPLLKLRHVRYHQRWLGIKSHYLHIFNKEDDIEPKYIVDITNAHLSTTGPHITIYAPKWSESSPIRLKVNKDSDLKKWVNALESSILSSNEQRRPETVPSNPSPKMEGARKLERSTTITTFKNSKGRPTLHYSLAFEAPPFTFSELEHSLDRVMGDSDNEEDTMDELEGWIKGPVLGKGAFGTVYLGTLKNGRIVAVKTHNSSNSTPESLDSLKREMEVLRTVRHDNVVRYFGCLSEDTTLYIFLEYVPLGALTKLVQINNGLPLAIVKIYSRQLLEGLEYLHSCDIIHRDIKCDNILLFTEDIIKLTDFGSAKQLCPATVTDSNDSNGMCSTLVGTPSYMAPEVFSSEGYSYKADIWSVGCAITEMLTSKPPWPEFKNHWAAMYHISQSQGKPPNLPSNNDPLLDDLLDMCFQRDQGRRPRARTLLNHPFFTSDDANKIININFNNSKDFSDNTTQDNALSNDS